MFVCGTYCILTNNFTKGGRLAKQEGASLWTKTGGGALGELEELPSLLLLLLMSAIVNTKFQIAEYNKGAP